jgi:hypothetical protein
MRGVVLLISRTSEFTYLRPIFTKLGMNITPLKAMQTPFFLFPLVCDMGMMKVRTREVVSTVGPLGAFARHVSICAFGQTMIRLS